MQDALEQTRALIASLDLSEENARVGALQAEAAEIDAASERASKRIVEIGNALASRQGPDGEAVADALLSGAEATVAADAGPTDETLRAEVATLRAGLSELARRREAVRREIDAVKDAASTMAREALAPLGEALAEELRAAATRTAEVFAAATALEEAVAGHAGVLLHARNALRGCIGSDGPLDYRRTLQVPTKVAGVLQPLTDKGKALPVRRILQEVAAP